MEPGNEAEAEDFICISQLPSSSSFFLRLHFYACGIAASYYLPFREAGSSTPPTPRPGTT